MKRLLIVLVLSLAMASVIFAQHADTVALGALSDVTLTVSQLDAVNRLAQTRLSATAGLQSQMAAAVNELDVLLDATSPDLSRIGTLSRQVRRLAAEDKQIRVQFRRDVWQLLTPAQRDVLLVRLGF